MFLNSLPPWEASKALEFTFTTTFFTTLHNDGIYQVSVLSIHFSDFCESTGNWQLPPLCTDRKIWCCSSLEISIIQLSNKIFSIWIQFTFCWWNTFCVRTISLKKRPIFCWLSTLLFPFKKQGQSPKFCVPRLKTPKLKLTNCCRRCAAKWIEFASCSLKLLQTAAFPLAKLVMMVTPSGDSLLDTAQRGIRPSTFQN